jgi:hypothetical protein
MSLPFDHTGLFLIPRESYPLDPAASSGIVLFIQSSAAVSAVHSLDIPEIYEYPVNVQTPEAYHASQKFAQLVRRGVRGLVQHDDGAGRGCFLCT